MSQNSGLLFLNKAIQTEDINVFAKHGIREDSFVSSADVKTYNFIKDYYEQNGETPSYAMVSDNVPEFTYVPEITDRFEALARGINDRKLGVEFNNFFEEDFEDIKSDSKSVEEIVKKMTDGLTGLRQKYSNTGQIGIGLKSGTEYYKEEYEKRKRGESAKTWQSFMPYLNEETGGYTAGNMYVVYGRSGRGKSAVVLREALEMAQQGANVLLWSLEMTSFEVMVRLHSQLSAKLGKTNIVIGTEHKEAGFDSSQMRSGQLPEDFEESLFEMLSEINEHIEGEITIRGVNDRDFNRRDVDQFESDIQATNADVAIIDPFYYMDYEKNESKTTGGGAAATSVKLRRLAGSQDVVVIAMTQAEEDESEESDEVRELKLPQRKGVKKTKGLLEDAATLIAVDTNYREGRGLVGINKGRNGGEGSSCELTFLPNYGLIEQFVFDVSEFDF